jgi:hypothetical protein
MRTVNEVRKQIRFAEEMSMTVTSKAQKLIICKRLIEELKLNEIKTV